MKDQVIRIADFSQHQDFFFFSLGNLGKVSANAGSVGPQGRTEAQSQLGEEGTQAS